MWLPKRRPRHSQDSRLLRTVAEPLPSIGPRPTILHSLPEDAGTAADVGALYDLLLAREPEAGLPPETYASRSAAAAAAVRDSEEGGAPLLRPLLNGAPHASAKLGRAMGRETRAWAARRSLPTRRLAMRYWARGRVRRETGARAEFYRVAIAGLPDEPALRSRSGLVARKICCQGTAREGTWPR